MNQLIGRLPASKSTPEYAGSITETATVIVDNKKREIKVNVNNAITESIDNNYRSIQNVKEALATKVEITDLNTTIKDLSDNYGDSLSEIKDDLLAKLNALDSKIDKLIPITIDEFDILNVADLLEVGEFTFNLKLRALFNKVPTSIEITANNISDIILNLDNESFENDYNLDYVEYSDKCILDFGTDTQYVTDEFYSKFTAIAKQLIEPEIEIEGDEENGYVVDITYSPDVITDVDGVLVINEEA